MRAIAMLAGLTLAALLVAPAASAETETETAASGFPVCWNVNVPGGVDMGSRFCLDPTDPDCILHETRTTVFGTLEFCWIPAS